jgi:hypothetical protein
LVGFFGVADNITAVGVAILVLFPTLRGLFKRTWGSRRAAAKALRSLTPGNPVEYVEDMFGRHLYASKYSQPPADYELDRDEREIEQRLYSARHGWLSVHYNDGKVVAFCFTLTDPKFKFPIDVTCRGAVGGVLGRTTFLEIQEEIPSRVEMFCGANISSYSEVHYFGRPGGYQYYSLSNVMHGWTMRQSLVSPGIEISPDCEGDLSREKMSALVEYRKRSAPDTIAVFGDRYRLDSRGVSISGSYHPDEIGNLEGDGPKGWLSRSDFARRNRRREMIRDVKDKFRMIVFCQES